MEKPSLKQVTALAKRRGFIFPGSEIYGGLANTYDYGPLGVQLKRNIENLWWQEFIEKRADMVGLDSSIILNSKVWEASGHLTGFNDLMVDCKDCHSRTRADHLIENHFQKQGEEVFMEGKSKEELEEIIQEQEIQCPVCGGSDLTDVREFSLLFPTKMGILKDEADTVYLRGETAQGIFINFKNILQSTRQKLPFGVGQIGKAFRNEITTGQLTFRLVEFTQAEIEYFFDPKKQDWQELFQDWAKDIENFVHNKLAISKDSLRIREHTDDERSHYSQKTVDLEYDFPFGYKELWGLAYRTDFDLKAHQDSANKNLSYIDPHTQEKITPHVIEPAAGIDRLLLMLLFEHYFEDKKNDRVVLRLPSHLAPTKVAVFPLLSNNQELVDKARSVYQDISQEFETAWDERGNIGKRYFYQDEAGTPFCLTIDHQTLEDNTLTVRDRDTTKQERIHIDKLEKYIKDKLSL